MYTSLYVVLQLCALLRLSFSCVIDDTLFDKTPQKIIAEKPYIISSKLGDIVHIDTGYYDPKFNKYIVYKPNGTMMDINVNITEIINTSIIEYLTNNFNKSPKEILYNYELKVGPLKEEDHGNWIFSKFIVDENCTVTEIYKTVSIEINEYIEPTIKKIKISEGDDLNISFPYPIPEHEMCELRPSITTYDRYYQRDMGKPSNYCGYTIPNVTRDDHGLWEIIAVGKIVYRTSVEVSITPSSFVNKFGIVCRMLPWCSLSVFLN